MASGFGISGGIGRCYPFFADFKQCVKEADDPKMECFTYHADYFECLHHRKEMGLVERVNDEAKKLGYTVEGGMPAVSKDDDKSASGGGH